MTGMPPDDRSPATVPIPLASPPDAPRRDVPRRWYGPLSLSVQMTLVCVAVALVAAALSGVAAARAVVQEDRIAAAAAAAP